MLEGMTGVGAWGAFGGGSVGGGLDPGSGAGTTILGRGVAFAAGGLRGGVGCGAQQESPALPVMPGWSRHPPFRTLHACCARGGLDPGTGPA
jgi:hypothetical protein